MRDGISAVARRNNSIHLHLWGGVQQHSVVLSTLRAALFLFAIRVLPPAHHIKKKIFATPYELQQSAVKTAD
jgi:hypothetical protein